MDFNFKFKMKISDEERYLSWSEIFRDYTRTFISEFIGTSMLVFFGCACSQGYQSFFNSTRPGDESAQWLKTPPLGDAMCFGLVIGSAIQVFGPISLAHFNPAVSLSFYIFGINSLMKLFLYIIAQVAGSITGIALLKLLYVYKEEIATGASIATIHRKTKNSYCCTLVNKSLSLVRAFLWEYALTSFLILFVCTVVDPKFTHKDSMPLKFGFLIFCLVFIGANFTGASLNPARSFGPAVLSGILDNHWLYWVAPLLASLITTVFYHIIFLPVDGQDELREAIKPSAEQLPI